MIKDGAKNALPQRVKKAVTQTPNTTEEPSDEKSKDTDYKKVYRILRSSQKGIS